MQITEIRMLDDKENITVRKHNKTNEYVCINCSHSKNGLFTLSDLAPLPRPFPLTFLCHRLLYLTPLIGVFFIK